MSDGALENEMQAPNNKPKKIPLKDKIMMGPLDKYQKYSK
jgi:hypothetical protein